MTKAKVTKILIWGIGIVLISVSLYYLGFGAVYYSSMKKANEEAKEISCEEQTNESFDGEIENVLLYEYDGYMQKNFFGLDIITTDSTKNRISYQFEKKPNENLLEFVKAEQKIKKERGKSYFELISSSGETRTFKVPNCVK